MNESANLREWALKREKGITIATLSLVNQMVSQYDGPVIVVLCEFFGVGVGELLVLESEEE